MRDALLTGRGCFKGFALGFRPRRRPEALSASLPQVAIEINIDITGLRFGKYRHAFFRSTSCQDLLLTEPDSRVHYATRGRLS